MHGSHPYLHREKAAASKSAQVRELIREAYHYCLPGMQVYGFENAHETYDDVVDSTAAEAAKRYAGLFMTRYVPPSQQFIKLSPGLQLKSLGPVETKNIQFVLDMIVEAFHTFLDASDFFSATQRSLIDYSISSGCLQFNESPDDQRPFAFEAIPLPQIVPEEGPFGSARTTFRRFRIAPRNIEATWPDAKLPDDVRKQVDDAGKAEGALCQDIEVVEAMVWDDKKGDFDYKVFGPNGEPWVERRAPLGSRMFFRNFLPSGSAFGRGPGLTQLPNIRQLCRTIQLRHETAEHLLPRWQTKADHPFFGAGGLLDELQQQIALQAQQGGGQ